MELHFMVWGLLCSMLNLVNGQNGTGTITAAPLTINNATISPNCSENDLNLQCIDNILKTETSSLSQVFLVTCLSGAWVIYLTYFNSRAIGFIASKIVGRFFKDARFHIGSFSFSLLSGKLMFRDITYITKDYSIHINDGYCIFRWWRPFKYTHLAKQQELSHGHTRLSVVLFGLECHIYNQIEVYNHLQTLLERRNSLEKPKETVTGKSTTSDNKQIAWWRSLFPVIKFLISPGKLTVGNRLLPNSLVLVFTEGDFQYKTTESSNCYDLFLHVVEGTLKSARMMLVPSLGFDPLTSPPRLNMTNEYTEAPPRKMGEGFVVFNSNSVTIKYCWDEPGFVEESTVNTEPTGIGDDQENFTEESNKLVKLPAPGTGEPTWDLVVQFGKNTSFNYGPWADRQREILWNYFYPADYQTQPVTKRPQPGELRIASSLKVYAMLVNGAYFDILFTRKDGIGSFQINSGEGSFVEVTVPMIVEETGYNTLVSGQLLHAEVTTTLQYQNLLKAEMLGFNIKAHYPRKWNRLQTWDCEITASKASLSLLFAHQEYFSDLMYDWSFKSPADLLAFVAYIYNIHLQLDDFELYLPLNKHNWIDCQTKPKENSYLALHGKCLTVNFSIPNEQFLPNKCSIPFEIKVEKTQLCAFLPENNMSRNNLLNLANHQKKWNSVEDVDDITVNWDALKSKSWGVVNSDWVVIGEVPKANFDLNYTWHPIIIPYNAPYNATVKSKTSLHSHRRREPGSTPRPRGKTAVTFDPTSLDPDVLTVDIQLPTGTVLILYGSIVDLVVAFKENYFGYDDVFTDFSSNQQLDVELKKSSSHNRDNNILHFRPFEVKVTVNLQEIAAILPIHHSSLYVSQPRVRLKRLHFELDKNFLQTRLQLLLVDLEIAVKEVSTSTPDLLKMSRTCRFQLSSLQLRGHAMFSSAGMPMGSVLIEYAWLTELLVGDIKGLLSLTQTHALLEWLDSFLFLASNYSNQLEKAFPHRMLPTGMSWEYKKKDGKDVEEGDVKYQMTRVRLQSVNIRLAHDRSLFDLHVSPVTIANGNLGEEGVAESVSVDVQRIELKHFVLKPASDEWLEAGELLMGPLYSHVVIACKEQGMDKLQDEFLRFHDKKSRRLFFLWQQRFANSKASLNPLLSEKVKALQSWGCSFFAPVVPAQSNSYQYRPKREVRVSGERLAFSVGVAESDTEDEDVFDSRIDFGMSLLEHGKILLEKPLPPKTLNLPAEGSRPPSLTHSVATDSESNVTAADALSATGVVKQELSASSPSMHVSERKSTNVTWESDIFQSMDSELYRSADTLSQTSQTAQTSQSSYDSRSSSEEFFSAESDLEYHGVAKTSPDKMAVDELPPGYCCNMKNPPQKYVLKSMTSCSGVRLGDSRVCVSALKNKEAVIDIESTEAIQPESTNRRPGNLSIFSDERISVARKLELSINEALMDGKLTRDSANKANELTACYGYILSTTKFEDTKDWLPRLMTVHEGVHPSMVVDKEDDSHPTLMRRKSRELFRGVQSDGSTSVTLHVKGGVDIQISPFLLDSVHQVLEALSTVATQRHPSSILSRIQSGCTRDAILDYHVSQLNGKDPSGVLANALGHSDGSKTNLKVFMDTVRINVVQATPGVEEVFNLRLNKMLPTPCLTIATIRLDRLDIGAELNSKKEKLLTKVQTRARLSRNFDANPDSTDNSSIGGHAPMLAFSANASVHSLACQLRVLSQNGCAPERSNVIALSDDNCRAPFKFNPKVFLPHVKEAVMSSDFQRRPPKPWGWVMFEAGINDISAKFVKHSSLSDVTLTNSKHVSEGNLNVKLLWLNAVSPPSANQMSKANRAYRTWNLLTALAPSCCAWLVPADKLISSSALFQQTITNSYFATVAAALMLASKSNMAAQCDMLKPQQSKYDIFLSSMSNSLMKDPNCILCDSLQGYFLDDDHMAELEAALADERNTPAPATLGVSIPMLLGQILLFRDKPVKKEKFKKSRPLVTAASMTVTQSFRRSSKSLSSKYETNIELTAIRDKQSPRKSVTDSASQLPVANSDTSHLLATTAKQRAENVVYEQQRSGMYNWVQSQNQQADVEAQVQQSSKNVEKQQTTEFSATESLMRNAHGTFSNFLTNAGIVTISKETDNLLQQHLGGSIAVNVMVTKIRMEKQRPDRYYYRDGRRKQKKEAEAARRRQLQQQKLPETPIIVCHNLSLVNSFIDSPIADEVKDKAPASEKMMTTMQTNTDNMQKYLKNRSKLSADVKCSVSFVKQRIDIALLRLIHQFVTCVNVIQQTMTDMQVNKYTAGVASPDVQYGHRRLFSNFSAIVVGTPATVQPSRAPATGTFRRRNTIAALHVAAEPDEESNLSLSDECLPGAACWQEIYKLVDEPTSGVLYASDHLLFESEMKKRLSTGGNMKPFVCFEMVATVNLEKIQLLAEVGDLTVSILLLSLDALLDHTSIAVTLFKNEVRSVLKASLKEVDADMTDDNVINKMTIVKCKVGECTFEGSVDQQSDSNECSLAIGKVSIDLPQRPSSIHDLVTKSTRRMTAHMQEFNWTPVSRQSTEAFSAAASLAPSVTNVNFLTPGTPSMLNPHVGDISVTTSAEATNVIPTSIKFDLLIDGIEFGANMLPSSIVRYTCEVITGSGVLGPHGSFDIKLLNHAINFSSGISSTTSYDMEPAVIQLPQILADGEMKQHQRYNSSDVCELQMKEGEYLSVSIRVGNFEHTLTSDLVNQLIYLQEVVVHELDNILNKMSSTDFMGKRSASDTSLKTATSSHTGTSLLYQLQMQLDGIQLTASTPSNNAVRLKTGTISFELSNRVIRANQKQKEKLPKYMKIFGKAEVELNLGLGTLIENSVYPEVEPEFQQLAYFTTMIGLQNTTQAQDNSQDEEDQGTADDNSILINVTRPIFFVQPTAFDKAILFFLVYKNSYDEWTEKREVLESTSGRSTTEMFSALQSRHDIGSAGEGASSLFLQLAVKDLGICLPVSKGNYQASNQDELPSALVLTIDHNMISAYYSRSLVSAGQFRGFCLRFTDDFLISLDDWAPKASVVNSFVVPDGTYQICTDTTSYHMGARTSVNVVWKMKGMDVKLDPKIGYYLTQMVDTMTLITGNSMANHSSMSDKLNESESQPDGERTSTEVVDGRRKKLSKKLSKSSRNRAWKEKSKKLENEYNEQVRVIGDLRALGAKPKTIEEQEQRLHELEVQLSSIFRRNFKDRLRRGSLKSTSFTSKSFQPSHQRSISVGFSTTKSPGKLPTTSSATLPSSTTPGSTLFTTRFSQLGLTNEGLDELSDEGEEDVDGPMSDDDDAPVFKRAGSKEGVDLELILDVRVDIDGGKIVCMPEKEDTSAHDLPSGSSRFQNIKNFESNETVFYVPGVTIKCRYNSTGVDANHQDQMTPGELPDHVPKPPLIEIQTPGGSKNTKKRSSIYIWFTLQSLPEMIISPCFLDFLEQTFQAIPVSSSHKPEEMEDPFVAVETLDSTIDTLPMDVIVYVSIQPSQVLFNCQPMSRVECLLQIPSLDACFSNIRSASEENTFDFNDSVLHPELPNNSKMSEFKAFKSGLAVTIVMSDFSIYVFHPYGAQVSAGGLDQKSGSGRKDSLSVDLEVVRINIVRSKKGSTSTHSSFQVKDKAVVVNMSTLFDIGKASFKYDMRRLSEILAFPRAWYRRSIARRLFLGDTAEEAESDTTFAESPLTPRKSLSTKRSSAMSSKEDWISIVLYCLKMSHLDVQMNMSNVMGNTLWSCDGLRSQGKLSLQSTGDQDFFLSCGLKRSQLTARSGIIGGQIQLKELYSNYHVLEPINSEMRHKLCMKMLSLDGRIEYMGGCIMMGKLTRVYLKLSDEWKGPKPSTSTSAEKSSVFVPGDFIWENFSLVISRSTTPDVIKMLAKLEEFFTQQFQSSVRAITSLTETPAVRPSEMKRRGSTAAAPPPTYAFHRQWPDVYSKIRSMNILSSLLLGGSLCLRGSDLTIVCFHGNNFRNKSWILFSILQPNIMFSTEVQQLKESLNGEEASTHSIQSLTFNLGHDYWLKTSTKSTDPMATVSRVSRSRHENPPPSSASIDEWFAYITASHSQELTMLRTLNDIRSSDSSSGKDPSDGANRFSSGSSYSHETDIIFALPKLQLDFKTDHMQGPTEPTNPTTNRPVVECSFVTEFTDHICVTMDVELIMCLHDLISSYMKEKQQALSSRQSISTRYESRTSTQVDPIDPREFICNTWQLEPTVRLISWAGRRIEPVGVDYILQKLGFRHARTTIPKWFQRGVLDVLDQTLAVIVQNLLVAMHQRKKL